MPPKKKKKKKKKGKRFEPSTEASQMIFFFFMAAPAAYGSSQARGQIQVTAVTYVIVVAMPDPAPGWGSNLCLCRDPSHCSQILNPTAEPQWELQG